MKDIRRVGIGYYECLASRHSFVSVHSGFCYKNGDDFIEVHLVSFDYLNKECYFVLTYKNSILNRVYKCADDTVAYNYYFKKLKKYYEF